MRNQGRIKHHREMTLKEIASLYGLPGVREGLEKD
jgi:hypothetical protein